MCDLYIVAPKLCEKYNCFIDIVENETLITINVYDNKHKFIGSNTIEYKESNRQQIEYMLDRIIGNLVNNKSDIYNEHYIIYNMQENSKDYPLSNFYPCKITYNGNTYTNIQSAYEAQKEHNPIKRLPYTTCDGYTAMKLSKNTKPNNEIMYNLLRIKFSNSKLQEYLISTIDKEILYINSWHDTYWGICKCDKCNMTGNNVLGKLLMKVRSELIEQEKKTS